MMEPPQANPICFLSQPRYGVRDSFEPEDLLESKNVPQVTKCVEELAQLVKNITITKSINIEKTSTLTKAIKSFRQTSIAAMIIGKPLS